jgi:hypothetical protein
MFTNIILQNLNALCMQRISTHHTTNFFLKGTLTRDFNLWFFSSDNVSAPDACVKAFSNMYSIFEFAKIFDKVGCTSVLQIARVRCQEQAKLQHPSSRPHTNSRRCRPDLFLYADQIKFSGRSNMLHICRRIMHMCCYRYN